MGTNRSAVFGLFTVFLTISLVEGPRLVCETQDSSVSAGARAYLEHALAVMQQNALHREKIDWATLRREAMEHAEGAEVPVDTYDAIRWALHQVNRHSFLQLSPELEKRETDRRSHVKAALNSARTEAPRDPASIFLSRDKPETRLLERAGMKIGYVVVPHFSPRGDADGVRFETTLQHLIAQLDTDHPRGWIVDLRGNEGGNMWPMLAGLGPLLGEGVAGAFHDSRGGNLNWFYRDGAAGYEGTESWSYPKVDGVPYRVAGSVPVAILIDRGTASSAEAVAVAFRGKPHTRSFGEHTLGVSTNNNNYVLSDGANMILTIGVYVDRNGHEYENGIEPDVKMALQADLQPPPLERDEVISGAEQWLISDTEGNR
jgi:carboxyl-terminal processing protease